MRIIFPCAETNDHGKLRIEKKRYHTDECGSLVDFGN
jgi:hypothetical protein